MARVSFTVDYAQNESSSGEITFESGGNTEVVAASGRLDVIGDSVVSPIITNVIVGQEVVVECVLTSTYAMRVTVAIGDFLDEYNPNVIERVIEDVPINVAS